MSDTGRVDLHDPRANMYGCLPCPKCGAEYRVPYESGLIECDDCGFKEPITENTEERLRG